MAATQGNNQFNRAKKYIIYNNTTTNQIYYIKK